MADYISREAAKQILSRLLVKDAAECACNLIECVLPADVEPVLRGRWGKKQGGFWEFANCSVCGQKTPTVGIPPNYCPNCGAKMELEDNHENRMTKNITYMDCWYFIATRLPVDTDFAQDVYVMVLHALKEAEEKRIAKNRKEKPKDEKN